MREKERELSVLKEAKEAALAALARAAGLRAPEEPYPAIAQQGDSRWQQLQDELSMKQLQCVTEGATANRWRIRCELAERKVTAEMHLGQPPAMLSEMQLSPDASPALLDKLLDDLRHECRVAEKRQRQLSQVEEAALETALAAEQRMCEIE